MKPQLDRARQRSLRPNQLAAAKVRRMVEVALISTERDEALSDYWSALQMLRLATLHLQAADDLGRPLRDAAEILKQVDRARQALQIVAACAELVGARK